MANELEDDSKPKLSTTERAKLAIGLIQKIPLNAQMAVLNRVGSYINRSGEYSNSSRAVLNPLLEPVVISLINKAVESNNHGLLTETHQLTDQIFQKDLKKKKDIEMIIAQSYEKIAEKDGQLILRARAAEIYIKVWGLDNKVISIASDLESKGRELNDTELLKEAGKIFLHRNATMERGIKILTDIGSELEAAAILSNEQSWSSLSDKQRDELSKKVDYRRALKGEGFAKDRAAAWLAEGKHEKALNVLLYNGREEDFKEATRIIGENHLYPQAVKALNDMEPRRAIFIAHVMKFNKEFIDSLVDKALKCSNVQIEAMEEQYEYTRATDIARKLAEAHILRKDYSEAADWAKAAGDRRWQRQLLVEALAEARRSQNLFSAVGLAEKIGTPKLKYQVYLEAGEYNKALTLACRKMWSNEVMDIITHHLGNIPPYGNLEDITSFLQERSNLIPGANEAIRRVSNYQKAYYEGKCLFENAAGICEQLGEVEMANIYRNLNALVPEEKAGCYITTACCDVMGLADDCHILTNLRRLRDEFIVGLPEGKFLIHLYYDTAPKILEKLTPNDLRQLFSSAIKPASNLVDAGDFQNAYETYETTVRKLVKKYLPDYQNDSSKL